MSSIAEKISEAVQTLPDQDAAEVLDFLKALRARREVGYEQAKQQALALLDDPPLALNGRYWSRDSLYDRLSRRLWKIVAIRYTAKTCSTVR